MITIVYGSDVAGQQNKVREIIKMGKYTRIIRCDPDEMEVGQFRELANTKNLFGEKIILELNLIKARKTAIKAFLEALEKPTENDVVVLIRTIPKQRNKLIKYIDVREKRDKTIFEFIDAVFDRKWKSALTHLSKLEKQKEPPLKIHSLLIRKLRRIVRTKVALYERNSYKEKTQSKKWTLEQLQAYYKFLYKADVQLKTGQIDTGIANLKEVLTLFANEKKEL